MEYCGGGSVSDILCTTGALVNEDIITYLL